jgi:hypothetical protein
VLLHITVGLAMRVNSPSIQKEFMWKCFNCGKSIKIDEPYVEIMHYKPKPPGTSTQKHFHPSCFEEIDGKDYL